MSNNDKINVIASQTAQQDKLSDNNGHQKQLENHVDLKTIVTNELSRISTNKLWIWKLFLLCVSPNILNGFHVSSYVFIGQMPNEHWCVIPKLLESNWTDYQIRSISSTIPNELGNGCQIVEWDYSTLSKMTYYEALEFTKSLPKPNSISCQKYQGAYQKYQQEEGVSIVPEWDLVCENSVWRTTVQVAISIGKFLGATTFGIISDKFGRRTSCTIGALLHILGGILTTFSPWYWLFLLGRFSLGASSSGLFYAGFTLCSENISVQARSWISVLFSMAYPVGMLYLALMANFLQEWRTLQLALTVPAFLLIFYCYFLKESPRWLISKERNEKAYKILFKKKFIGPTLANNKKKKTTVEKESSPSALEKFKNAFIELSSLYGSPKYRKMAIICHFTWFATSLSYYVTAINADNISANRIVYVASTGGVDIASIISTMILLRFVGRKLSICILYGLSSTCLLILLAIPRDETDLLVTLSMLARFGITAVYAVVTLHTAEMFPTDIRNSALGTSSMCGHIGSMAAPYIVDFMGLIAWYIPTTICGVLIVLAALLTLTHPETRTSNLKDKVKISN